MDRIYMTTKWREVDPCRCTKNSEGYRMMKYAEEL